MSGLYVVKFRDSDGEPDVLGMMAPPRRATVDVKAMSARGLWACDVRDRQGDICPPSCFDLTNHRMAPTVLIDHGKYHPLPIGRTMTPDGLYTVDNVSDDLEAWQTTYFAQSSQMAEQVFRLLEEDMIRGNSAGFRARRWEELPDDAAEGFRASRERGEYKPAGRLVTSADLAEISWCGVPVNPEAARAVVCKSWGGRPLAPALVESFRPWLPERKPATVTGGWDGEEKAWGYLEKAHQPNPPHPGLVFDESRHRWVRPEGGGGGGDAPPKNHGGGSGAGKEKLNPPAKAAVRPASDADALASSVKVDRRGKAGRRGGETSAGVFFSPEGESMPEYGDEIISDTIPAGTRMYEGNSSILLAEDLGMMDDEDGEVKRITGLPTLRAVQDAFADGTLSADRMYDAFQTAIRRVLEAAGYHGAHWTDEEDLAPEQYQVWAKPEATAAKPAAPAKPSGRWTVADKKRRESGYTGSDMHGHRWISGVRDDEPGYGQKAWDYTKAFGDEAERAAPKTQAPRIHGGPDRSAHEPDTWQPPRMSFERQHPKDAPSSQSSRKAIKKAYDDRRGEGGQNPPPSAPGGTPRPQQNTTEERPPWAYAGGENKPAPAAAGKSEDDDDIDGKGWDYTEGWDAEGKARGEGEVWQGQSGRWFTMRNRRAVPAKAPGSEQAAPAAPTAPAPAEEEKPAPEKKRAKQKVTPEEARAAAEAALEAGDGAALGAAFKGMGLAGARALLKERGLDVADRSIAGLAEKAARAALERAGVVKDPAAGGEVPAPTPPEEEPPMPPEETKPETPAPDGEYAGHPLGGSPEEIEAAILAPKTHGDRIKAYMGIGKKIAARDVTSATPEDQHAIVAGVRKAAEADKFSSPTIPALYAKAKEAHPGLTLADFQTTLAQAHQAGTLRLGAFSQDLGSLQSNGTLAEALPMDGELKYYVRAGDRPLPAAPKTEAPKPPPAEEPATEPRPVQAEKPAPQPKPAAPESHPTPAHSVAAKLRGASPEALSALGITPEDLAAFTAHLEAAPPAKPKRGPSRKFKPMTDAEREAAAKEARTMNLV